MTVASCRSIPCCDISPMPWMNRRRGARQLVLPLGEVGQAFEEKRKTWPNDHSRSERRRRWRGTRSRGERNRGPSNSSSRHADASLVKWRCIEKENAACPAYPEVHTSVHDTVHGRKGTVPKWDSRRSCNQQRRYA